MEKKLRFLSLLFVGLMTTSIYAQDCGCDFTLKSTSGPLNTFKASDYPGYKPGDVFCLEAGSWSPSLISGFVGTEADPIVFKNCDGLVEISGVSVGLEFEFCENIHVTGTGEDGLKYGIKVIKTDPGRNGITFVRRTTGVEIDHVEVTGVGSSGISAKTDPNCSDTLTFAQYFTFKNLIIHDNYIHEVSQEGLYVGYTGNIYNGGPITSKVKCNGVDALGHFLENVDIYDNIIENTGRDGIQVSLANKDMKIHDNYVNGYGRNLEPDQRFGLSIGSASTGLIYNNIVINNDSFNVHGNSRGMSIQSSLVPTTIYNNVIINSGGPGVWLHQRNPMDTLPNKDGFGYYVINNTIINPGSGPNGATNLFPKSGILYSATVPGTNPANDQEYLDQGFFNNIITRPLNQRYPVNPNFWKGPDQEYVDFNSKIQLDNANISNNYTIEDKSLAQFTDTAAFDFSIGENSPARNFGMDVSSYGVTHDINGVLRGIDGDFDAGAFEYDPFSGINEKNENRDFSVYPNPAKEKINVSISLLRAGDARIKIIDMSGRKLFDQNYNDLKAGENEIEINMNEISHKGLALLVLFSDEKTRTNTIVIE